MSGIATITMRKYMILRAFDLPIGGSGLPWTVIGVALTRLVPAINSAANQLDEPPALAGYGRIAYPWGTAGGWTMVNDTEAANTAQINFNTASAYWGSCHGWALIAYGLPIAVGTLNTPLKVETGMAPYIPVGGISFGCF